MKRASHIVLALVLAAVSFPAFAGKASEAKKKAARPPRAEKDRLLLELRKHVCQSFEKQDSPAAVVKGFVTYSRPAKIKGAGPYVAYVYAQWGDVYDRLDAKSKAERKALAKAGKLVYRWDGGVVMKAGRVVRAATWSFDAIENPNDVNTTPGKTRTTSWSAKASGGTDAVLVRLDLVRPTEEGAIKVGKFAIPFTVKPEANGELRIEN